MACTDASLCLYFVKLAKSFCLEAGGLTHLILTPFQNNTGPCAHQNSPTPPLTPAWSMGRAAFDEERRYTWPSRDPSRRRLPRFGSDWGLCVVWGGGGGGAGFGAGLPEEFSMPHIPRSEGNVGEDSLQSAVPCYIRPRTAERDRCDWLRDAVSGAVHLWGFRPSGVLTGRAGAL